VQSHKHCIHNYHYLCCLVFICCCFPLYLLSHCPQIMSLYSLYQKQIISSTLGTLKIEIKGWTNWLSHGWIWRCYKPSTSQIKVLACLNLNTWLLTKTKPCNLIEPRQYLILQFFPSPIHASPISNPGIFSVILLYFLFAFSLLLPLLLIFFNPIKTNPSFHSINYSWIIL